jgi:hypothetical protein
MTYQQYSRPAGEVQGIPDAGHKAKARSGIKEFLPTILAKEHNYIYILG